ncbi:hypothetical protein AMTRI_Chr12g241110 [Amborella trichopoda]
MEAMLRTMARAVSYGKKARLTRNTYTNRYQKESCMEDLVGEVGRDRQREDLDKAYNEACWIPDQRSGIYYPKGQERIMVQVPVNAAMIDEIHWFGG